MTDIVQELLDQRDARMNMGKIVINAADELVGACLMFVFQNKDTMTSLSMPAREVLCKAVLALHPEAYQYGVVYWHDREATDEQVYEVFDRAIRMAKEQTTS